MQQFLDAIWTDNGFSRFILLLILCLFVSALYFSIKHIRRYLSYETQMLNRVAGRLRRWKEAQGGGAGESEEVEGVGEAELPPAGQPLLDIHELKDGIPRESIIGDRLEAIAKMRASRIKASADMLQQMSLAKEATKLGLGVPGFAVGFAMLLGLLGTVFGLALMVKQIDAAIPLGFQSITSDSWQDSLKSIKSVLGGMKTAFSTTLAGLICSIFSAGLNFFLGSAQARYFKGLDRFTVEELLPTVIPSVEDESLLERVSLQLETSFGSLDEVSLKNTEILKDLNAIEQSFLLIVDNIQKLVQEDKSGGVQGVVGELSVVVRELTKVNQSVVTVTENVPHVLEAIKQGNRDFMQRFDDLVRLSREQAGRLDFTATRGIPVQSRRLSSPGEEADDRGVPDYKRSAHTLTHREGGLKGLLSRGALIPGAALLIICLYLCYLLWHLN
jgi:biopolymer transport protein ExbB/TolQ